MCCKDKTRETRARRRGTTATDAPPPAATGRQPVAAESLQACGATPTRPRHATRGRGRGRGRGFSLVEMMVVLVLIGLLAGLVTVNVRRYLIQGRQNAALAEIASFKLALDTYYSMHGRYPGNGEGLEILRQADSSGEPLITGRLVDPWGNPYQYISPGRGGEPYEVISYGADGREGGEGADRDLSSGDADGQQAR